MKPQHLLVSLVVVALFVAPLCAAEKCEEGFASMFNGKDLSGWEGLPGAWRVENGAIVGQSTPADPCQRTHYLYWTGGKPADFIFRCDIKLQGGNSGIQFRSEKRPKFDTFGYQADFDAKHVYSGALYQHKRGKVVDRGVRAVIAADGSRTEERFAGADELLKKINDGQWNEYEIVARGNTVTLSLNGVRMCEVVDNHKELACRKGIIAVQMHKGPPMKVQFRNLRIKMLDQ